MPTHANLCGMIAIKFIILQLHAFVVSALSNHSTLSNTMPPPSSTMSLAGSVASVKKKAPPPPPPVRGTGHMRNPSDPGFSFTHSQSRSPSDPPPLPAKTGQARLPGAKLVLPPVIPPKPRTPDDSWVVFSVLFCAVLHFVSLEPRLSHTSYSSHLSHITSSFLVSSTSFHTYIFFTAHLLHESVPPRPGGALWTAFTDQDLLG